MATISPRPRADGSVSYTAQIRIRRKGKIVYQESNTSDSKRVLERWAKQREAYIDSVGVEALLDDMTVGEAINQYIAEMLKLPRGLGRSKLGVLKHMADQPALANLPLVGHTKGDLYRWVLNRVEQGVAPATAGGDVIFLKVVLEHARTAWDKPVDLTALADMRILAKTNQLIDRSESRDRVVTVDELDRLLAFFDREVTGRGSAARKGRVTPMVDILMFQLFSTRRVAETCRITWADYDEANARVMVRDMKHSRKKNGNDRWVSLPPRAVAIINAQPRDDERIFPFNERSVGAYFQRACRDVRCDVAELRLHDLRHSGITHLFELGWDIPRVAMVSGHLTWDNLKRYTHLTEMEPVDRYVGWGWLERFGVE